ncbi:hypothetical protein HDF08_001886 [Edaphobacter lichenicola]|uniref:Uncharacterized protein n=1 Tax=Tunturiibacter lichenicola TaxID=2051959 RepID=A0A852VFR1_9BACT|nr:hypothetical protein [Edaphobacter lichenicola]
MVVEKVAVLETSGAVPSVFVMTEVVARKVMLPVAVLSAVLVARLAVSCPVP